MHAPVRATLTALAAALAMLVLATPSQAAEVGVVGDVTWGQPRADVDREIELLRRAGVRWIRANVNWAGLEPDRKGEINEWLLAEYDYAIDRAQEAGLQVLMPIADGVPYWASADPARYVDGGGTPRWEVNYRPQRMSDYGDFVRFVVGHFAPKGVLTYMIWNEPNHPRFWPSGPDASAYVPMLRAGYNAVKAASPEATVLLGGLSKSDFYYLEAVYRAGGGDYFDAVAVQPYTYGVGPTDLWNGVHDWEDPDRISINAFPAIQEVRRSMVAFGDGEKDVWLTEFGYSTTTQDGGVSAATQAEFLAKAYRYVERFPWVQALFWYAARNSPFYEDRDEYEARFGLATTSWGLKQSYWALRAHALDLPATGRVVLRKGAQRNIAWGAARVTLRGRVALSRGVAWRVTVAARAARRTVLVQRRTPRGWVVVARVPTTSTGAFRASVVARGSSVRYRAVARYEGLRVRSSVVRVVVRG
ncbi:MAG TPA: cellulase family glycosylhydrolase [Gaiellaceae bacterium]|nr:cellulase family glycosylhydrolase [Gaiellaceae bacterium]